MLTYLAALALTGTLTTAPGPACGQEIDPVVADRFAANVAAYVDLHRRIEEVLPPLEVTEDTAEMERAIAMLAAEMRYERADATQGDIFADEIADAIRLRMAQCVRGTDVEALLAWINEENPFAWSERPEVNATYPGPGGASIMPPHLLAALPPLPEELEYRFMNRDLILWDTHARLIADYVPRALPAPMPGVLTRLGR
jgi:hypothetical protein